MEEVEVGNFNTHLIALTYKVKVGKTMPEFLYNFYWLNNVACSSGLGLA